ncbi:uncharacterized protein [Solanum tuberosum]|uniref:uncharacterized protein n=1 Tax=Solanum tuberosum TaxID=4113 RepID=UPI00073A30D3|nr:PREDICTED: uncharacterized protein LOC107060576 [Solanum tuberosum]
MKELHCIPEVAGLSYEGLCIHSNLDLLKGFKVPKFDVFGGTGNPLAHLRGYCDQLMGVGRDEALLMWLFSRSLSGEALEWFTSHETRQWPSWNALAKDFIERFAYNVEIVPDRYSLEKTKQKSNESYREFSYRWRKEATRVRPPMSEKEIVEVFVRVQEPDYYDRIMLLVRSKSAEIVKVGETIEDRLRTGKITRVAALPGSSSLLKKKREDVSSISYEGKKTPMKSSSYQGRSRPSQSSYSACYAHTDYQIAPRYIHPVGPKPVDTSSRFYRPDQRCAYHSNGVGHDTEDCINLKHLIQDLIDQKVVSLQTVASNVNSNPLPNHGGITINMIDTDDDWCVIKAIIPIAPDELERAVASLYIREKQALMKALDDTYVPVGTNSDNLAAMIHQVIRGHRITKLDLGKVHQNQVNVRAFYGVQRDMLGAVNLDIQMGPAEFNVKFQVLSINTSYNLLLGRPFIHMAGVVPSTLHQLMKFVWKDQELVIHGEGSHSNRYAPIVDEVF